MKLSHSLFRHLAAICSELGHHLFVQPNIHLRRVFRVARVAKLPSEFLASVGTAVEIEQLQQINNRLTVVELPFFAFSEVTKQSLDINACWRRRPCWRG